MAVTFGREPFEATSDAIEDYFHLSPDLILNPTQVEHLHDTERSMRGSGNVFEQLIHSYALEDLGNQYAASKPRITRRAFGNAHELLGDVLSSDKVFIPRERLRSERLRMSVLAGRIAIMDGQDPSEITLGLARNVKKDLEAINNRLAFLSGIEGSWGTSDLIGRRTELVVHALLLKSALSDIKPDTNEIVPFIAQTVARCDANKQMDIHVRRRYGLHRSTDLAIHFLDDDGKGIDVLPVPIQVKTKLRGKHHEIYDTSYAVLIGGNTHLDFEDSDSGSDIATILARTNKNTLSDLKTIQRIRTNVENEIGVFLKRRDGGGNSVMGRFAVSLARRGNREIA